MARSKPYQSFLFRVLHFGQGLLALLGIATGFWLHNTWDQRWGAVPFPQATESAIDLHGGIGGAFTPAIALFVAYSLFAGRRRLVQTNSLAQLTQLGRPAWWYALHRFVNTGLLLMDILAVVSGEDLSDDALMARDLSGLAYNLHVSAWAALMARPRSLA